ncbi:hypothetical protein OJAV_G00082190 [Oryzias javanicus]|uniref:Uncharacterized protein n=1 Tax=Oryzias javanicus TaxID=123683 RepID=A0A437D5D0_ORYJA|nr:hypothetical protein OJAV_G00082190 [Oryzias javanicus]
MCLSPEGCESWRLVRQRRMKTKRPAKTVSSKQRRTRKRTECDPMHPNGNEGCVFALVLASGRRRRAESRSEQIRTSALKHRRSIGSHSTGDAGDSRSIAFGGLNPVLLWASFSTRSVPWTKLYEQYLPCGRLSSQLASVCAFSRHA